MLGFFYFANIPYWFTSPAGEENLDGRSWTSTHRAGAKRATDRPAKGGPENLRTGELPDPKPAAGEVLVRMRAAGLGPWDLKVMNGMFGEQPMPFVPGFEFAGIVEALGEGTTGVAVGDAVYGTDWRAGSLAELRAAAAGSFAATPSNLDLAHAAAVPVGGSTALEGIVERLQLKAGESILITAASGGVGTFAVQIAHQLGARVIAIAGAANHDYVRRLGADEVFDYRDSDWAAKVRHVVPGGVDALFDAVGGESLRTALGAIRDGGRAVFVAGPPPGEPGRGVTTEFFSAASGADRLKRLAGMIEAGALRIDLVQTFAFDDAREALEQVAQGHTRGKLVVTL